MNKAIQVRDKKKPFEVRICSSSEDVVKPDPVYAGTMVNFCST